MEFYEKWMGCSAVESPMLENFKGPALAMSGKQSRFAPLWLPIFKQILEEDKEYGRLLQRHYKIVKAALRRRKAKQNNS